MYGIMSILTAIIVCAGGYLICKRIDRITNKMKGKQREDNGGE